MAEQSKSDGSAAGPGRQEEEQCTPPAWADRLLSDLEDRLVRRLRLELLALHLGDDYVIEEETAAQLLRTSARTMRRLRESDEISAGRLGKSPRYSLGMLRRFMRRLATEEIKP